ncbi:hypothetical protein J4436_02800 [Candidatus Woesearchaeota archaeon]|nr:hypothetical protein [Candidatus Woesearchaeota archaeon]
MNKRNVCKEIPLAEITLRKYERPSDLSKRDLIRKLCLSIGLLQPGDSRDIIVDVFLILFNSEKPLSSEKIQENVINYRKENNLSLTGIASSNIRRQIKRLKDIFLIEKNENGYRINEGEELINIYEQKIEKFYLNEINTRVKEYFRVLKK